MGVWVCVGVGVSVSECIARWTEEGNGTVRPAPLGATWFILSVLYIPERFPSRSRSSKNMGVTDCESVEGRISRLVSLGHEHSSFPLFVLRLPPPLPFKARSSLHGRNLRAAMAFGAVPFSRALSVIPTHWAPRGGLIFVFPACLSGD